MISPVESALPVLPQGVGARCLVKFHESSRLLGHSQVQTTAHYAHLARDSVHEAVRRISDRIEANLDMDNSRGSQVRLEAIVLGSKSITGFEDRSRQQV